jgi:predicted ArsR family transcriptional regulator
MTSGKPLQGYTHDRIVKLLELKMSIRQIALQLGVSRTAVRNVANILSGVDKKPPMGHR